MRNCWRVLLWARSCSSKCSYFIWSLDDHFEMLEWDIRRDQWQHVVVIGS
jgi:hypothetical protein